MKKILSSPTIQIFLFIGLFIISVILMKFLFHISERWVNYVASAVVAIITFLPGPIIKNLKYSVHKRALRKEYVDNENLDFGIKGYAFCDHDDRGYINALIRLQTQKEQSCLYNLDLSFSENANQSVKLKKICNFINAAKSEPLQCVNIDELIRTTILPSAQKAIGDKNGDEAIFIVDSIYKNRKDQTGHEEASVLTITLVKSNRLTKAIIDTLYNYLKELDFDTMTASYKTSSKLKIKKADVEEMMCFTTTLEIFGCILKQSDEEHTFYIQRYEASDRVHIPLDMYSDIDGRKLANIVDGVVKNSVRDRLFTRFTDVALSYKEGVIAYLMCCVSCNDPIEENPDYIKLKDGTTEMHDFIFNIANADAERNFYYSYAVSLMRKIDKKRFDNHI